MAKVISHSILEGECITIFRAAVKSKYTLDPGAFHGGDEANPFLKRERLEKKPIISSVRASSR
jgi:hypothetical protein